MVHDMATFILMGLTGLNLHRVQPIVHSQDSKGNGGKDLKSSVAAS